VNGVWVNNILYADDTVLISDNLEDLPDKVGTVGECSKNMGININIKNTKFMIITRNLQEFQNSSLTYEERGCVNTGNQTQKSDTGLKMPAVRS